MAYNLTRKQIEDIYNSVPMPDQNTQQEATYQPSFSSGLSRDEIANIYNSYTPEIPKLEEQNTPPAPSISDELKRMEQIKSDVSAPRTQGEQQAIDTYYHSLTEAQRYLDSQKPQTTGKKNIGKVEVKADGTKKYTKAMSNNEQTNYEHQLMEQAKVVGKQAKENAQPRERALSANEQRDLERAQQAIAQAKENNNPYTKLAETAKKFTNLPKKDKPRYDDRGFEINPSITENQDKVDEYLDPNKKLSEKDLSDAKKLIREYENSELGQKNENATTLVFDEAHPDGIAVPMYAVDENGVYQPSQELTPEERAYQQSMGELKTKVDDSESFLVGAMKTIPFVDALQKAGDVNGEYARMSANSLKQNPLAYMGGLFTGGAMSNAAGQFALKGTGYGDWLAKTLGADKSLGRQILTDALMDAPVDVATDIIPTLTADVASGMSAGDVAKSTLGNIGINAAFNLGGSVLENLGDIIGAAKKAPVRAFEDPIKQLEGLDYFETLADRKRAVEQIPIMEWFENQRKTALANGYNYDYQGVPVEYNDSFKAPETLVHNLTGEQVSPEYADAVRKLESGQSITSEEYNAIPEVIAGKERVGKAGAETYLDKSPERELLRNEWFNKFEANSGSATREIVDGKEKTIYNGIVRKDRRADIILGLPSSGKSSAVVDPISYKYKSRLIDSDEAKKVIPEFDKGWGAGRVHEESSDLADRLLAKSMASGENVIIPKVGANYDSIEKLIGKLRREGYSVNLHFNELDPNKAAARNLRRFANQGRFLDLDTTSFKYGNKPSDVFERLIREGKADGYTRVSNDVRMGEYPVQLKGTENISFDWGNNRPGRSEYGQELGQISSLGETEVAAASPNNTQSILNIANNTNQGKQPIEQGAFFDANEIPRVEEPVVENIKPKIPETDLKVDTVNLANGKKAYYVVAKDGDFGQRPVMPGKVFATEDEAKTALKDFAENQGIPKDVSDYVQARQDVIEKVKAARNSAEAIQGIRSINAMDEYMYRNYPEWFDNGNFRMGEFDRLAKTADNSADATKSVPLNVDKPANPSITSEPIPRNKPTNSGNVPPTNNVPPTPTGPVRPPEGNGELVERGMSRHVRNDNTPMRVDVPDEIKVDFEKNPEMFKRMTNAETKARADAIFERGGDVETTFRRMLSQKDPASLALGHRIAKELSANGQYEKAAQIYRDMGKELTQAGQFSQASVLAMMKNDPLTALYYAQKEIDKLNVDGAKRFGDKWKNFELTPEEVKAFGKIDPGNEKAIADLYDQIGTRLGKEYPTTLMDKLLEARRVSMLFNLRTNLRNFFANVPTLGMRSISDRIDSLGQHYVHLLNPDFEVTNSLKGAGIRGRKLANQVYKSDTVQALLKNTNGKYSPDITSSLMQNKQMFKGTPLSKWINRSTNGGIEKLNKLLFKKEGVESGLETIRNATYKALELGDNPFVKENFVERLGSYINARGIKNINDIPDDAIQVAWEEAMKATYKDNSWAVQMLRGFKNGMERIPGIGRPLSQATIPFLQAPGNIAARMVDYSPIKATKGIVDMISGANANDLNKVRKGIEEFSKGATGTGMIVLGMKLKESGLITGDYSEDKDQRNFEKQHGFKPYALHIGDKYFTYDWAQPFAEPMIIGTLLQEAIDNSDKYDSDILKYFGKEGTTAGKIIGGVGEGVGATVNSWFNASPLQGIADLMKGDYSGEADIAQNIFDTTVSDFASSFIPSLVNATAKSVDPTIRNTYDPSNTFGTFLNEQAAKLPGFSDNLPAKYDTWGNEMKYADSKGESFARKFVVPGDYGKDSDDPIDQEINSLFDATSDNRVFPLTAPNSVDGVKLNNREVSEYQEDMGTRSREIVESFMDSDYYNDLADNEKAETLNTIYSVSKAITERDLFDKPVADNSTYKKAIEAYDADGAEGLMDYLEGKAIAKEAGVSSTSKASQYIQDLLNSGDKEGAQRLSEEVSQLGDEGLNTEQQGVYASRGSLFYDADDYASLYDKINADDKPSITQKEAINYLNDTFKTGTPEEQREALQVYESMVTKYTPGESKFAKYDPTQKKYVAVDPKDAKNQFKTTLIPKVEPTEEPAQKNQDAEWDNATLSSDPYTAISQSGIGHGNQYMDQAWDKAILANPSLTPQEFIDTWAAIDSSGNGKHDKSEFKTYLNSNNIGEQKGNLILDMYYPSNWNRITYSNGTWK